MSSSNNLISSAELNYAIIKSVGKGKLSQGIRQMIEVKKINKFYQAHANDSYDKFIDAVLKRLNIKYELNVEELKRIPKEGSFIIVSNHSFGSLDGLLLIKILSEIRPDIKILANTFLQRIKPIRDFILPINPFEIKKDKSQSLTGIKLAISHLKNNSPLIIFPSGDVAKYDPLSKLLTEGEWQYSILKFIKNNRVPVLPIYFHGRNSKSLFFFNYIPQKIEGFPSELFNPKNRIINIRIGNIIKVKDLETFNDINQFGRFLRVKTNSLGSPIEVKKFFRPQFIKTNIPEPIVPAIERNLIINEINNLPKEYRLFQSSNFCVYCSPAYYIPNTLNEIGRLREITFREVHEGTNKSIDIDEFDLYYYHLFIWDIENNHIVGAYRVGKGKEIINTFGKRGFYLQSLFKINDHLLPLLSESLELGRSFIYKDYQQKPLPLFLLWKGILYFLLKHPEYRYLIGPVSISNHFSKMSKALIIEFIKANYYDNNVAEFIKPRTKFKVKLHDIDTDIINEATKKDINKLDKFIEDIEPMNFKLPVLLKKYIKLNGRIVGFNIDPKFNDALDGLILLDLFNVPKDTIESLAKELEDKEILKRFDAVK